MTCSTPLATATNNLLQELNHLKAAGPKQRAAIESTYHALEHLRRHTSVAMLNLRFRLDAISNRKPPPPFEKREGDENFGWYWGIYDDPEVYFGPFETRELALKDAVTDYPEELDDMEPLTFSIVEADKIVPSDEVFDADTVLSDFQDLNDDCWGEDGLCFPDNDLKHDLESTLKSALTDWRTKHKFGRAWLFATTRSEISVSLPEAKSIVQEAAC